jgi:hypothetical protein
METGEHDGDPYTDILFILEGGTYTPSSLRDMQIQLGLDSSVSAHITTEGNGLLFNTPLSIGRIGEIIGKYPIGSDAFMNAYHEARKPVDERARQVNLDSARQIRESIRAGLGHTWSAQQ